MPEKSNWEKRLEELKEECDKADRELWPNRFALRAEYNARRYSLEQKRNIESYAYQTRPSGLLVPVQRKDGSPIPDGTLESPSEISVSDVPYMPSPRDYQPGGRYNPAGTSAINPTFNPRPYRYQQPKSDDTAYEVPSDEQKFIQRVGMQSNCNVNIQSKRIGGTAYGGTFSSNIKQYRMFCEQCKASQQVDASVILRWKADDPLIAEFCRLHRHDASMDAPVSSTATGRKFRDA